MHAKRRVGIDDVSIGFIRDSGGNTVGIEGTTQVMEQWGEQRAEFEGSPEADWSITMDDETLSYNGVLSQSVEAWSAPIPIAVVGAVQVFNDLFCSRYADGSEQDVYVRVNRRFGVDSMKEWGSYQSMSTYLRIDTPTQSEPELPYSIELWIDYHSEYYNSPIEAGTVVKCHAEQYGVDNPQVIFYDE